MICVRGKVSLDERTEGLSIEWRRNDLWAPRASGSDLTRMYRAYHRKVDASFLAF